MLDTRPYYRNIHVTRRILEYCGVPANYTKDLCFEDNIEYLTDSDNLFQLTNSMTTEYLVGWGGLLIEAKNKEFESVKNYSLGWLLDNGLDIFRAVWDKENMIIVLDVEYYSKRYPGNPYADQNGTFAKLEPFHKCLMAIFKSYGIDVMAIATGQGYHYSMKIPKNSDVYQKLCEIGHMENSVHGKYNYFENSKRERAVTDDEGLAYDGCGKLMEFLTHIAIEEKENFGTWLPVMVGDIAVGNESMEAISVDLSAFANPIFMRDVRVAFSSHHKHKVQVHKVGKEISENIPIQLSIPRYVPGQSDLDLHELFQLRRHFENSAHYASQITTEIPDCSNGILNLFNDYKNSYLYKFHQDFDNTAQHDPSDWWQTYDKFDLSMVPPCVSHAIDHPNPHLLQPTQIQTLVRTLTGKNWWHPKDVAGLIRSKYERDHSWEINWNNYDANTWACVWTRIYAGMIACGIDQKTDFNCISHQEKGNAWADKDYCVLPNCGMSLGDYM